MDNKTIEPTPIPAYPVFDRFSLCGCDNSLKCKEDCIWYDEEPDMGAHIPFCKAKNKFSLNPEDCQNCDRYTTKYKKNKHTYKRYANYKRGQVAGYDGRGLCKVYVPIWWMPAYKTGSLFGKVQ